MTYEEHRAVLIAYLKAKVESGDWHGVSDAANDLRVLEASPRPLDEQTRIAMAMCPPGGVVKRSGGWMP